MEVSQDFLSGRVVFLLRQEFFEQVRMEKEAKPVAKKK